MKAEYKYRDNDEVEFDSGAIRGTGYVVGACNTGLPFIGVTYMIDVNVGTCSVKLPNEEYPFSFIPMCECHMKKKLY